jgi:DNA-directed RNA polymerase specialized sigma24 family protein
VEIEVGSHSAVGKKKDWQLTQAAFDLLLAQLDPDRDTAGKKYEELRRKLVKFFGFWGSRHPEDLADKTITTAARKLLEGETIENLNGYMHGTARLIYKETVRDEVGTREAMSRKPSDTRANQAKEEQRRSCHQRCLRRLPADEQDLIVRYYQGPKAPDREGLAAQMGISLNLLRVSAFRIRKKLRDCLQQCLQQTLEL